MWNNKRVKKQKLKFYEEEEDEEFNIILKKTND